MFCTDCGKALDVGTRVCPNCNALTEEIMDEVTSDVDNSDLRQSKHEFVAEAQISQDANLQRNMETSRPQAIAFGDWQVRELAVVSSRGIIPLDQVSCSTYDQEPRNMRNIVVGLVIILAGLYAFTNGQTAGLFIGFVGGVIIYLALQTKRTFRLYSTSGYYFEGAGEEFAMGNSMVQNFQSFNVALIEHRDRYLVSLKE